MKTDCLLSLAAGEAAAAAGLQSSKGKKSDVGASSNSVGDVVDVVQMGECR